MKDKYTLLILPPESGSTRQVQLSKKGIRWFFALGSIFGLALLGILIGNIYLTSYIRAHQAEFSAVDDLKSDLAVKEQEISRLRTQNQEISENLEQLNKLEASISSALNLPSATPTPSQSSAPSRGQSRSSISLNTQTNVELSKKHLALFQTYYAETQKLQEKQAHTPSIVPVHGRIASSFGYRQNPFGGQSGEFHHGLDLACDYGSEVHATADGVVTFSGWDGAYGQKVELDHGNGIVTFYAHNSKLLVQKGASVKKGQLIALSGTSGRSTGSHLHYGVILNGVSVDPSQWINGIKEP